MFQAVKFPTGITDLDSSLANVDWDTLTLKENYFFINWCFILKNSINQQKDIQRFRENNFKQIYI